MYRIIIYCAPPQISKRKKNVGPVFSFDEPATFCEAMVFYHVKRAKLSSTCATNANERDSERCVRFSIDNIYYRTLITLWHSRMEFSNIRSPSMHGHVNGG